MSCYGRHDLLSGMDANGAGDARACQPPGHQCDARRARPDGRFLGVGDVGTDCRCQRHPARQPCADAAPVPDIHGHSGDRRRNCRPCAIAGYRGCGRLGNRCDRSDRHAISVRRALPHIDALRFCHRRAGFPAAPWASTDQRRGWTGSRRCALGRARGEPAPPRVGRSRCRSCHCAGGGAGGARNRQFILAACADRLRYPGAARLPPQLSMRSWAWFPCASSPWSASAVGLRCVPGMQSIGPSKCRCCAVVSAPLCWV